MSSDLESFRRIAGDNPFRAWLETQREDAIKSLTHAVDVRLVHIAQGRIQLLDKQLELLEKAKNLR